MNCNMSPLLISFHTHGLISLLDVDAGKHLNHDTQKPLGMLQEGESELQSNQHHYCSEKHSVKGNQRKMRVVKVRGATPALGEARLSSCGCIMSGLGRGGTVDTPPCSSGRSAG